KAPARVARLYPPSNYKCGDRRAQFEDPEHQDKRTRLQDVCTLQDRHPFLLRQIGHDAQFKPASTKNLEERYSLTVVRKQTCKEGNCLCYLNRFRNTGNNIIGTIKAS